MKTPFSLFLALLALTAVQAAEPETATKMRIKEVPEKLFFCAKKEVKMADVPAFATETFPALVRQATESKLGQKGPLVLSIIGFTGDPEQAFTIEADFPAARKDDEYKGPLSFRTAAKFKCASVIYQGSMQGTGGTWKKLLDEVLGSGKVPSGESREVFLNFEGEDSADNVIELQMGIQ